MICWVVAEIWTYRIVDQLVALNKAELITWNWDYKNNKINALNGTSSFSSAQQINMILYQTYISEQPYWKMGPLNISSSREFKTSQSAIRQ